MLVADLRFFTFAAISIFFFKRTTLNFYVHVLVSVSQLTMGQNWTVQTLNMQLSNFITNCVDLFFNDFYIRRCL